MKAATILLIIAVLASSFVFSQSQSSTDYSEEAAYCQQVCTSEISKCTAPCGDNDYNCREGCMRKAGNPCIKKCYIKFGLPKKCVDLYDIYETQPFIDCLFSTPPVNAVCGNGQCEEGEDPQNCPSDCSSCGNGVCDSGENAETCPQDCSEICDDNKDNDGNGFIDCEDEKCKDNPLCGALAGTVYYEDLEGEKPLKRVAMVVSWASPGGEIISSPIFYTDDSGKYSFDDPRLHAPGANDVSMAAGLRDEDRTTLISEKGEPVLKAVNVDSAKRAAGEPQDIVFDDVDPESGAHLRDAAKIYTHTLEAADFASQFSTVQPEDSEIFYDSLGANNAFHNSHSSSNPGMFYGSLASVYDSMEAPTNREYHEYSHHIMNYVFGSMPPKHRTRNGAWVDVNHGGYANHCSSDSWAEGFAEFMALVINTNTGEPKRCGDEPYRYCVGDSSYDIENDYTPGEAEELAVAGILWDIYDNAQINNDGYQDDDYVSVDFPTLWATLTKVRNFTNYYAGDRSSRHIWYVKDLYDALKQDGIGQTDSDGNGRNDLDDIFLHHGYYYYDSVHGDVYGAIKDNAGRVRR